MQTGTIKDLRGSWGSGIATLVLDVDGEIKSIPCDNGPTVRALQDMFGCIMAGHTVDVEALRGREVQFDVNDYGLLSDLAPAE